MAGAAKKLLRGRALGDPGGAAVFWRRSHGRVGVTTAEGEKAIGGASDIEVEGEVLVDGEHVAQVALQRIAGVEPLRPVTGPQRLHRLARLPDREGGMRAKAQLGLEVGNDVALRGGLESNRRLAQERA